MYRLDKYNLFYEIFFELENLVFCSKVKDFCCSIATAQGPSQPPGPAQNGSQNHRVEVMDLGRWRPMQVTPQKWPIPSGFWGLEGRAREGPSQPHMATPLRPAPPQGSLYHGPAKPLELF